MLLSTDIKKNIQEQMEFKTLYPLGPFLRENEFNASFSSDKDLVHFLAILAGRRCVWDWLVFGQEWRSIAQTYISYISYTRLWPHWQLLVRRLRGFWSWAVLFLLHVGLVTKEKGATCLMSTSYESYSNVLLPVCLVSFYKRQYNMFNIHLHRA